MDGKKIRADLKMMTPEEVVSKYPDQGLSIELLRSLKKLISTESELESVSDDELEDVSDVKDIGDISDISDVCDVKDVSDVNDIQVALRLQSRDERIKVLVKENTELKKMILDYQSKDAFREELLLNDLEHKKKYINTFFDPKITHDPISSIGPEKTELVPVFFFTDVHIGEVVNPDEVGGVNSYNQAICKNRINQLSSDFIRICSQKLNDYVYPALYLIYGGDNVTGNIHGLDQSNDLTPTQQVLELVNIFEELILKFKKVFPKIIVPAVTGNHGRMSEKMKTKGRTDDSLEMLALNFIRDKFKDDPDVIIDYNKTDEVIFDIYGRTFLLTHGDQGLRGGSGIAGPTIGIKRGRAKLLERYTAMGKKFDTLIIGHYHQHYQDDSLIIGASPKGYDEYVKYMNMPYSDPGISTFFVNTHGNIIFSTFLKAR
jgi:predicted phosphodiesterase